MKARVNLTTLRRLASLEQRRSAKRTIGAWPCILGYDEWEALALPHQERLCSDTRGNETVVITESLPDPADVTHRYKPTAQMFGTRIRN